MSRQWICWKKNMISISYHVRQIPLRQVRLRRIAQYSPERKIQVTGFGDNQFLKAVTGGIRTVHFAYQTSGIKGAELLLEMIESEKTRMTEMKLGCELV